MRKDLLADRSGAVTGRKGTGPQEDNKRPMIGIQQGGQSKGGWWELAQRGRQDGRPCGPWFYPCILFQA